MATRVEVQEITIDRIDAIYQARKDRKTEPKAFIRTCDAYFTAFAETPPARLQAAMERLVKTYEGPFWPTPAVIRRHMPEELTQGAQWTAMPHKWKWDSRLPELRRLCRWDSGEDPLVAIANSLATGTETDPWLTMRSAMASKTMAWESYGETLYPTGSQAGILNARALVEKYAAKMKIDVNLAVVPLDSDWSDMDDFARESGGG